MMGGHDLGDRYNNNEGFVDYNFNRLVISTMLFEYRARSLEFR